jgi:hypothetical protein
VYGAEFPGRKLPGGRPVSNYDDLVELLRSKASSSTANEDSEYRIEVAELPFEGKNIVVYGIPGWMAGSSNAEPEEEPPSAVTATEEPPPAGAATTTTA